MLRARNPFIYKSAVVFTSEVFVPLKFKLDRLEVGGPELWTPFSNVVPRDVVRDNIF